MNVQEVIEKCVLCPGICTYRCPVFLTTKYRASAPVNIARAIYFSTYLKSGDFGEAVGYCSLCNKCMETCPVGNPLPEAIKHVRRESKELEKLEFTPQEKSIYTSGRLLETEKLVLGGIEYKINSTEELYKHISYGYLERMELPYSYNEDPDVFKNNFSINLLQWIGLKYPLNGYILHKPCKVDDDTLQVFRDVFGGEEERIIEVCMGGGGLDILAPKLLNKIKESIKDFDSPIVTQCSRAASRMRKWGLKAYTPLEVIFYGEEINR